MVLTTKVKDELPGNHSFSGRVKTPTVLQMEMVECGAAALGIVLGYYGRFVPLEELRVACGVSRDGSKASNIVKAARSYGLEAKGFRKELEDLKKIKMPAILFWEFNHFVVLEGFHRGRVYINDPAKGPLVISEEELDNKFTGIVLTFGPAAGFEKSAYRPSIYRSLLKRLTGLKSGLAVIIILGLFLVIPGILLPAFTRVFVDDILLAGRSDWFLPLIAGIAITFIAQGALIWARQYYLLQLETRMAISGSGKFLWHVLRLPTEFYYQRMAGEVTRRVQNNDFVAALLTGQLATAFLDFIVILFFFVVMFFYDPVLSLLAAFFAVINLLVLRQMGRKRSDDSKKLIQEQGQVFGTTMNGLQMIETLKATGQEDDFFARWSGYQADLVETEQELGRTSQVLLALPQLLMSLAVGTILVVGGYRIIEGMLTVGMLVAFQGLMQNFMDPVKRIVNMGKMIHEVEADMSQLDDVMNHGLDPELKTAEGAGGFDKLGAKLSGKVELKNLTFGYSRFEKPLIKGFNLSLNAGSRVALVGPSGSGKSTVARLVAGLFMPWEGEILFDDVRRENIPRPVLNSSIAIVDQKISMLEGTIKENITLWNEIIPETSVFRAARDAGIDEVIARKVGGYDSKLQEGGKNFSGGERQRLDLARALSVDPTILILDEATSALDPLTEKAIDENIRRRGCTCILVAHRLSTIRDCDEIIVLDRGEIVQRGTHEYLLEKGGLYADLISNE